MTNGPFDEPGVLLEIGDLDDRPAIEMAWHPPGPPVLLLSDDESTETRLELASRRQLKNGRHE